MEKGQESMPIELLLGVTILTFVMIIGFYSYRQVCMTQYDEKVATGLNNLARTIEQAYRGGVGTSPPVVIMDLSPPAGCNVNFESVRLVSGTKEACQRNTGKNYCVMAVAITLDEQGNRYVSSRVYIDIPEGVSIRMEGLEQNCGAQSIIDVYDKGFDPNEDCGWGTGSFALRVTKETTRRIRIDDLS